MASHYFTSLISCTVTLGACRASTFTSDNTHRSMPWSNTARPLLSKHTQMLYSWYLGPPVLSVAIGTPLSRKHCNALMHFAKVSFLSSAVFEWRILLYLMMWSEQTWQHLSPPRQTAFKSLGQRPSLCWRACVLVYRGGGGEVITSNDIVMQIHSVLPFKQWKNDRPVRMFQVD